MTAPNPGSREAIDAGCDCPMFANRHGRGVDLSLTGAATTDGPAFQITDTCPLHGSCPSCNNTGRVWLPKPTYGPARYHPHPCRDCGGEG